MQQRRSKGEVIILQRYAAFEREGADILEREYSIPFAQHEHAADIVSAVIANNAGLLDMHAALLAGGDFDQAADLISKAIARLHAADELLFRKCTRGNLALLIYRALSSPGTHADRVAHAYGEADRADEGARRRRAYVLRHRILDAGGDLGELPPDDQVLPGDTMVSEGDTTSSLRDAAKSWKQPFGAIGG